ncbi:MAG TPA: response regulator [Sphingomicrobium sp.]|nr:response regulator [Sphingomicrobium sp.]
MAQQSGESQRLLVVDGDVLVRHVISDYLRTCGYIVVEAATTDEALVVLEDTTITIDAALCDAEAPGSRSGFHLRIWAAENRPQVEVILAGSIAAAANKAAELCEEGPHLRRPYDPQSVLEYIRRIIGSRSDGRLKNA